jgi:hypothetical protein
LALEIVLAVLAVVANSLCQLAVHPEQAVTLPSPLVAENVVVT